MELLSSNELKDTILYFSSHVDNEVDPIAIASVILAEIVRTLGEETPTSLTDSLPREHLIRSLEKILAEAKEYIEGEDITDEYWGYIGHYLADDYETLEENGKAYDAKVFYKALNKLKKSGLEIYITNWKKYSQLVWNKYAKIKGYRIKK